MASLKLKVARIGNSRGVRLPARTLARYEIGDTVLMEERGDGILLRPRRAGTTKLSLEDTAAAMAAADEAWDEWDVALADGLDRIPWDEPRAPRVAGKTREYRPARTRRKK